MLESQNKILVKNDFQKIKQVLINLLTNAFKFTSKGQVIIKIEEKIRQPDKTTTSHNSKYRFGSLKTRQFSFSSLS